MVWLAPMRAARSSRLVEQVDGDDRIGRHQRCRLDDVEADPAGAEHHHQFADGEAGALLTTTPKPVVTAQPNSAATSRSPVGPKEITVSRFSATTAHSLKVVTQPALTLRPCQP